MKLLIRQAQQILRQAQQILRQAQQKTFTIAFLLLLPSLSWSQNYSICKDSTRQADTYFQCQTLEYEPVCGCDQVTYRNACAAENWGGLINNGFYIGWTPGTVCGNFDFDFVPTAVVLNPVEFSIFMKSNGSASLYIYSRYGALMYADYFNFSFPGQIIHKQLNLNSLEIGVYFAVVVVNGEKQYKKFSKVYKY